MNKGTQQIYTVVGIVGFAIIIAVVFGVVAIFKSCETYQEATYVYSDEKYTIRMEYREVPKEGGIKAKAVAEFALYINDIEILRGRSVDEGKVKTTTLSISGRVVTYSVAFYGVGFDVYAIKTKTEITQLGDFAGVGGITDIDWSKVTLKKI